MWPSGERPVTRLLALFPHRDSIPQLLKRRRKLFSNGVLGAFSFPPAAPLAVLTRSLEADEIRKVTNAIATEAYINGGKIAPTGEMIHVPLPAPTATVDVYGPRLAVATPPLPADAVASPLPAVALCACVVEHNATAPTMAADVVLPFAVAYCANVAIWALSAPLSYEWIIGRPFWFKTNV